MLAKWIGNLGRKNAMARLAHLLCEMGIRMEQAGLGSRTKYQFPASQSHLADALGLTPVHTNRTLQTLRAEGLARAERRMVYVTDWERLASIAEFDPEFLLIDRMDEQRAA